MDKFVRIVCDLLLLLLLLFGPFRPLIRFLPNNRTLLLIRLLTFAWLKTPSASSFFALFYVIEDILPPLFFSLYLSLSLLFFISHRAICWSRAFACNVSRQLTFSSAFLFFFSSYAFCEKIPSLSRYISETAYRDSNFLWLPNALYSHFVADCRITFLKDNESDVDVTDEERGKNIGSTWELAEAGIEPGRLPSNCFYYWAQTPRLQYISQFLILFLFDFYLI